MDTAAQLTASKRPWIVARMTLQVPGDIAAPSNNLTAPRLNVFARRWLSLAVVSLLSSGMFALLLVVGRMPIISDWLADPGFFRRCLVLHVNLSLLVWFAAYTASIYSMRWTNQRSSLQQFSFAAAVLGTVTMASSAFIHGAEPVLSNYIPFIDHPLFAIGLTLLLAGIGGLYIGTVIRRDSSNSILGADCSIGIQAAAGAFLIAGVTIAISWLVTRDSLSPERYYELVAWGGGHILIVANVAAMLTLWMFLVGDAGQSAVIGKRTAIIIFAFLALPHLGGPLIALAGTETTLYQQGFTRLMQFGIFPGVIVILALCSKRAIHIIRRRLPGTSALWDVRIVGFLLSATMTIFGFILGAMIRGSTTLIPAHYHASIGAVTVAFMAATYILLGARRPWMGSTLRRRLPVVQVILFGFGQLLFSTGFAISGFVGLGRKIYAQDQVLYGPIEYIGIATMGIGGLIAVSGGALYLFLVLKALFNDHPTEASSTI